MAGNQEFVEGFAGGKSQDAIRGFTKEISRAIPGRPVTDIPEARQAVEGAVRPVERSIFYAGAQARGGDANGFYSREGIRGKDRRRSIQAHVVSHGVAIHPNYRTSLMTEVVESGADTRN